MPVRQQSTHTPLSPLATLPLHAPPHHPAIDPQQQGRTFFPVFGVVAFGIMPGFKIARAASSSCFFLSWYSLNKRSRFSFSSIFFRSMSSCCALENLSKWKVEVSIDSELIPQKTMRYWTLQLHHVMRSHDLTNVFIKFQYRALRHGKPKRKLLCSQEQRFIACEKNLEKRLHVICARFENNEKPNVENLYRHNLASSFLRVASFSRSICFILCSCSFFNLKRKNCSFFLATSLTGLFSSMMVKPRAGTSSQ